MANQATEDLLKMAKDLVKQYGSAELIITSRIHAGLPCLEMNTPVIFITNEEVTSATGTYDTPGRLGGLIELFRIMNLQDGKFSTSDPVFAKIVKFNKNTSCKNKSD